MRLRYMEHGQGAEVVVLLHDLAESSLVWEHLAAFLKDMGYRVLAPDLRGERSLLGFPEGLAPELHFASSHQSPYRSCSAPCTGQPALMPSSQQPCLQLRAAAL